MGKTHPVIWKAEPHTIAKIEILKNYLNAWFPIVGSRFDKIMYIDGFSGPGLYENHPEGSPVAALNSFRSWISKDPDRIKVSDISAFFIESHNARFEKLCEIVAEIRLPARLKAFPIKGEFATLMDELLQKSEFADYFFGNFPVLIFADPFGGTGVPFRIFERILASSGSELILNFDADGISRIHAGKNEGWEVQLTAVFGSEEWRHSLGNHQGSQAIMSLKALELYKSRLLSIPGINYVWSFEMRGSTDRINYYLIFATRNRLGMEKMKEAMRAIDDSGHYCFSDAHFNQHTLFRNDDIPFYAGELHREFVGSVVDFGRVDTYALTMTPFTNPKSMLEWLSRNDMVRVEYTGGLPVRLHTFPADRVLAINFVDPGVRMQQGELL